MCISHWSRSQLHLTHDVPLLAFVTEASSSRDTASSPRADSACRDSTASGFSLAAESVLSLLFLLDSALLITTVPPPALRTMFSVVAVIPGALRSVEGVATVIVPPPTVVGVAVGVASVTVPPPGLAATLVSDESEILVSVTPVQENQHVTKLFQMNSLKYALIYAAAIDIQGTRSYGVGALLHWYSVRTDIL